MITWNPNDKGNGVILSNNNLTAERPKLTAVRATEGRTSGKWYWETYIEKHTDINYSAIIMQGSKSLNESPWGTSGGISFGYYQDLNSHSSASLFKSGTRLILDLPTYITGDTLGVAIDLDISPRIARFYKNGIFIVEGEIPWNNEVYPAVGSGSSDGGITTANFGATKFDIITSNPEEWNRLKSEGYLPYDIDSAKTTWWGADIENVNISKTNIWHTDKNNINLSCFISHLDNEDIKYKILVNNIKAVELDNFISTPTDINIDIPIDLFTKKENLLELVVFDEGGVETSFKYNVIKENRDTFIFKRIFDFKEDYITDENIEVIYGRGLTLKEIGQGEVNIEIPTEGKSKISNIVIEGGEDKEEELIIEREMTYLNDLGEGKVYESRLLTEYSDIMDIRTSVVDGKVYDCGENSTTNPIEVNKFSTGTVTFRDEYIYLTASSGQTAVIATRNAIDLSKVNKVVIDNDYNPSDYIQYKVCTMSINKTIESAGDEGVRFIKTNSVERKEHVLDVADLEGEFYIKISVNCGTRNGRNPIAKIHGIYLLDADDKIISGPKHLCISNNKYLTYRDNEFIEVEPTVENFKEKNIYLSDLTTPTDKVILTMEGGEESEDGKIYRKTIDMSKYKSIEKIGVK